MGDSVDVGKPSGFTLLRRIFTETTGYRWHIAGIAALGLLGTPLALLGPVPLKIAVDSVIGSAQPPAFVTAILPESADSSTSAVLAVVALLVVVIALLSAIQSTGKYVLETYTGERITLRFRARLLDHAQRLSFAFHDRRGTADSIYRIQWDAPAAQYVPIFVVLPLAFAAVTFAAMVVVIFRIDTQLALVAVAISPVLYVATHTYSVRMRPSYTTAKELESSALAVVQEVLTSVRVVAAFGRENQEGERFRTRSSRHVRAQVRLAAAEMSFSGALTLTTAVGTAAVLYIGVRRVLSDEISLGSLLVVLGYLTLLYGPLTTISSSIASLQGYLASAERVFELLDERLSVVERPDAISVERAHGEVRFHDVTFGYEPGIRILKNVSFVIPPGAKVGVLGRTGSGKTTLVSLLSRFYDPDEGAVLLDGLDLRSYRIADLRNQFSIVLQDPVLFSTSIGQNIAYARPDASDQEIRHAARAADAEGFIEGMPDGFETVVGERGMRLSGGERQRISLARAFLKDAPILILDEPTSSVDSATEASIMEAMERLMRGRTTFMIAHRLSTLKTCDLLLEVRDAAVTPKDLGGSTDSKSDGAGLGAHEVSSP